MATIGHFMQPRRHSDVVDLHKVEPAPVLSHPAVIPFERPPKLTVPMTVADEPFQPPPTLSTPAVVPFQHAPTLSTHSKIPFQHAPALSVPAVIPFQDPPVLSLPPAIPFQDPPALSVTGSVPFQDAPVLSSPTVIAFEPPPSLPHAAAPRSGPQSTPGPMKHSELVIQATAEQNRTPGILESELKGLVSDVKGMLKNQTISNQVVVTIPGIGGMASIPLPLDLQISTHGDKLINVNADLHLRQAGVRIAQTALTYGRSKAQAAVNAGLKAIVSTVGSSIASVTPGTGLFSSPTGPLTRMPLPNPGDPNQPDINAVDFAEGLPVTSPVEAADPEFPYSSDASQRALDTARMAATDATTQVNRHNRYNPESPVSAKATDLPYTQHSAAVRSQTYSAMRGAITVAENAPWTENRYFNDEDVTGIRLSSLDTPVAMDMRVLNDATKQTTPDKRSALAKLWLPTERSLSKMEFKPNPSAATYEVDSDQLVPAARAQPAGFKTKEGASETHGYFAVTGSDDSSYANGTPSDDQAYVPLVFTDLRALRGSVFRTVYFRPFIKSLSEDFAPQWNMTNYFGRVDPVATYQSTNRTVSLSFKLVCFSPEDLVVLYQKLGWLTSMVYPEYEQGASLRYRAGPVVKMRVGDVINAVGRDGNRGLPGVITSLNFSYDESPWELLDGRRLPKNIDVSLGFHVLHEYAVGSMKGTGADAGSSIFGGIDSRNNGAAGEKLARVSVSRFRASFGKDYLNDPKFGTNTNKGA